nr:cytochrome C [Chloroflexia bacterium]
MCFKNLPVELDGGGKARLRHGVGESYAVKRVQPESHIRQEGAATMVAAPPRLRDWNIDPVTRVAGALAVHTVLDLENRKAVDAHSQAMLFRGYEVILEGRDPRDAIDISSRACG